MKKEFNLRKISELDHIIRIEQVKKWKQATERSQWYMIKDWNQIVCLWFLTVCSLADSVRLRSCKRIRLSSRWELSLKAEWNGQASSFMTFYSLPLQRFGQCGIHLQSITKHWFSTNQILHWLRIWWKITIRNILGSKYCEQRRKKHCDRILDGA